MTRRVAVPNYSITAILLLFALTRAFAQSPPGLAARIDALLDEPGLKGGFQGVIVQSLRDGSVWYERNPDKMFIPASNEKLLTSAAVLNALGPDWRYRTSLLRTGEIDGDGLLHGDLVLCGSGDPLLAEQDLDELAAAARAAGIRRVEGRVLGDDSRFDAQRYGVGWEWDDMSFYYSAQVSGLNVNENVALLHTEPGRRVGDPIRVSVTPLPRYLKIENRARTTEKGGKTALTIERVLGENRVLISGTLALDTKAAEHAPARVTVEEPARFAAELLRARLEHVGVIVTGKSGAGKTPEGATEIAAHSSPPMGDMLKRLNKPSDNLLAECFLKTLGAEASGAGTWAAGREAAVKWFASIGMDPAGIEMTDGSGLSRHTFVTPRNLVILLRTMYRHPYSQAYIDSLPIAGVDGTLSSRMKGTPAAGNCRAKTGYVSSASSLSGYVTTKDGEPLLLVMLMNNHKARNAVPMGVQDRIVALLAGYTR